ncbi:MAG: VWA domain-containing protein [Thiotrichaceae bacterium]
MKFICLLIIILINLVGCVREEGRIVVILDNSSSMTDAGTPFEDIKHVLLDTLTLVPNSYEIGLRVFSTNSAGSLLVAPYRHDLSFLRSVLSNIGPQTGTYIGQSLHDATSDLLEVPNGNHLLIMVTDGEGDSNDVLIAQQVKIRLSTLQGQFKCEFILFSTKKDALVETPVGQISTILGCNLKRTEYISTGELTIALQQILSTNFYWLWIIISALAFLILLILSAQSVFATQIARGTLPRYATSLATLFFLVLLPLVMSAHIIGIFTGLSNFAVLLIAIAIGILVMIAFGSTKNDTEKNERSENNDDPFRN